MATEQNENEKPDEQAPPMDDAEPDTSAAAEEPAASDDAALAPPEAGTLESSAGPMQLGTRRFVYAAYFAGAIGVAFILSKAGNLIWGRIAAYKPDFGEPRDDLIMPVAAVVGALVAFYYWRQQQTRQYAEEVASELSQVTWPSRPEVTNSTTVVIIATAFATIFFALMDRFWAFLTDLVYRF